MLSAAPPVAPSPPLSSSIAVAALPYASASTPGESPSMAEALAQAAGAADTEGSSGGVSAALSLLQHVVMAELEAPPPDDGGDDGGSDDLDGNEVRFSAADPDLDIDTDGDARPPPASSAAGTASAAATSASADVLGDADAGCWEALPGGSSAESARLRRVFEIPCGRQDVISAPLAPGTTLAWKVACSSALPLSLVVAWHPGSRVPVPGADVRASDTGASDPEPETLWGPTLSREAHGTYVCGAGDGCVVLSLDNRASAFTSRLVTVVLCREGPANLATEEGGQGEDIVLVRSRNCWALHEGSAAAAQATSAAARARRLKGLAGHPLASVVTSASGLQRVTFPDYFGIPLPPVSLRITTGGYGEADSSRPPSLLPGCEFFGARRRQRRPLIVSYSAP